MLKEMKVAGITVEQAERRLHNLVGHPLRLSPEEDAEDPALPESYQCPSELGLHDDDDDGDHRRAEVLDDDEEAIQHLELLRDDGEEDGHQRICRANVEPLGEGNFLGESIEGGASGHQIADGVTPVRA